MCQERGSSISDQGDSLCNRDCELRLKKRGIWICCVCDFGFRGTDRNRYGHCMGCDHAVWEDCKKWTRETAAELLKVDEEKEACVEESAEDDNGSEQATESEDKDDEAYGQRDDTSASGSIYSPCVGEQGLKI